MNGCNPVKFLRWNLPDSMLILAGIANCLNILRSDTESLKVIHMRSGGFQASYFGKFKFYSCKYFPEYIYVNKAVLI